MTRARRNHVSVHAPDLESSVDFYAALLDAQPIPTLNFGFPVQWLAFGDTQPHLFERDHPAPSHHHFALEVDPLAPVYRHVVAMDSLDATGAGDLPADVRAAMRRFAEVFRQDAEQGRARFFLS